MKFATFIVAIGLVAIPGIASAHGLPVDHGTLAAGFMHPLLGLDHLVAMVTVGVWAAQVGGRALWGWPAVFAAMMLAGFLAGREITVPGVEPMIAASGLVLGLLAAAALRIPALTGAALVGFFAVFHGLAHGAEAPESGLAGYIVGMIIATLGLHGVGLAIGGVGSTRIIRGIGGAAAVASLILFTL